MCEPFRSTEYSFAQTQIQQQIAELRDWVTADRVICAKGTLVLSKWIASLKARNHGRLPSVGRLPSAIFSYLSTLNVTHCERVAFGSDGTLTEVTSLKGAKKITLGKIIYQPCLEPIIA